MRNRFALVLGAMTLTGIVRLATGQEGAPGDDKPPATPEQITEARGELPADLVGRWLAVGWIAMPENKARTTTALWEIVRQGGALGLVIRFANLPEVQQKALDAANAASEAWKPTPADLAAIAAGWGTLPAINPKLVKVKNEVVAHDAFDKDFQSEARTKDARWAIRQTQDFHRSAAPSVRQINVFGGMAPVGDGWTGNYTTTILAAAPFPIPITLNGTFELYRLGGTAAPRGLIARLFDMFSGCGK